MTEAMSLLHSMPPFMSLSLATLLSLLVFSLVLCLSVARFVTSRRKQDTPRAITVPIPPVKKEAGYGDSFPPSQRHRLAHITSSLKVGAAPPLDLCKLIGFQDDYRLANPDQCLFSGFTIHDVRALGNFPDYASLSEVPLPQPLADFDITKARPRPYRPFRWPYHQTMGLYKMEPDFWLELESTYFDMLQQRQDIYAKNGKDVLQALPGSELACKELMEMVIQFLCARYPSQFTCDGKTFNNQLLGKTVLLSDVDPLQVLMEHVPEDFAIMLRDPSTGRYHFRAGVICASTGWSLGSKIGKGLPDIHAPVPDYKEKMQLSMDRFFTKLPASKPIQRGAWGFEVGQHLYMPPGHPDLARRAAQCPSLTAEDLYLRIDWQTLRRLPLSGAIVFNFKAFFFPLTELMNEPYIPSLSLKIVEESKANLLQYKSMWHLEHVLKPTLRHYERCQIERNMIEKDWEHKTLQMNPFFPGWEGQWPK